MAAIGMVASLVACGDGENPIEAEAPCLTTTASVAVTVSGGLQPTFSWEPACGMALLLVEEDSGDQWGVTTDDATWVVPAQANLIAAPVAYGIAPASTSVLQAPQTLVAGTRYELILWRILPPGNTGPCLAEFFDSDGWEACLVAAHGFTP
jgi:hypothetical protein